MACELLVHLARRRPITWKDDIRAAVGSFMRQNVNSALVPTMNHMLLRPIADHDDAQVRTLVRSCLSSAGLAIPGTAYFDPQLPHLTAYYAGLDHAQYWVVEVEGHVVAGAGIAPVPGIAGTCELQKLYVDAAYRGRGYATVLMDQAIAYASQWYQWCYLETHTKLAVARSMYAKRGFKPLPRPLTAGEHQAMDHWAIKDLSGNKDYPSQ